MLIFCGFQVFSRAAERDWYPWCIWVHDVTGSRHISLQGKWRHETRNLKVSRKLPSSTFSLGYFAIPLNRLIAWNMVFSMVGTCVWCEAVKRGRKPLLVGSFVREFIFDPKQHRIFSNFSVNMRPSFMTSLWGLLCWNKPCGFELQDVQLLRTTKVSLFQTIFTWTRQDKNFYSFKGFEDFIELFLITSNTPWLQDHRILTVWDK